MLAREGTNSRTLRILNYAINGIGVGHVVRLKTVSQWMDKLAVSMGIRLEHVFLTSSELDGAVIGDGLPIFKIPSPSVLRRSPASHATLRLAARDSVWAIVERLRPDLLIMDTVPAGSFDEFVPMPGIDAIALCRRRVFIYRPVRTTAVLKAKLDAVLPRYDLILVPEKPGTANVYIPESVKERAEWTGPIVSCERSDLLDRKSALKLLGLQESGLHVYISFGGGGHQDTEGIIRGVCQALAPMGDTQLLLGVGPLYKGHRFEQSNVVWLNSMNLAPYLAIADVAISAAGYNTFNELMMAGIPTVFMPLDAAIDDQWNRARRAESVGAAVVVNGSDDERLIRTVQSWRDSRLRARVAEAARMLVSESCASLAAGRILGLFETCQN